MGRKKSITKRASKAAKQARKQAGRMTKQARKLSPQGKRSLGSRISKAAPGGSGAIAGVVGALAANRGGRMLANKLKDKTGGSGSLMEKAKEGVQELVGGGDESASQVKLREIIQEHIDVSAPAQFTYEQWTEFEDLSEVFKGVEWVKQEGDGKLQWTAKIGPVSRQWGAEITEERENERIEWESTGGSQNAGVVAFHPLEDNLTRIMIQMEYHPKGLLENVGNFLRIQRRRVRRDLRLFKHHVEIKAGPPPPSSKDEESSKSSSREEKAPAESKSSEDAGRAQNKDDSQGARSQNKDDSGGNGSTRYEDRPMDELLKRAAELGIEGRSNMNKQQLIEALRK
jgi:uncharacterized membrane protein